MPETIPKILKLQPAIKNYSWGLTNPNCWVSRFCADRNIDPPFAEAWFGAHSSGPATVCVNGAAIALDKLVSEYQDQILGSQERNFFNGKLPLLPKVLSIGQPLSIQLHPSQQDAARLHQSRPMDYPDPFAKDEASIALGEVELLHSLLSFNEIYQNSETHPELSEIIPQACWSRAIQENKSGNNSQASTIIFEGLLRADQLAITEKSKSVYRRLGEQQLSSTLSSPEKWILKLESLYPNGDTGVFCFLIFNYIKLAPGEAISLNTGTPHAYLSGELLEVMKPSDNVIRCGLTGKFIDLEELGKCLDRNPTTPKIVTPTTDRSATGTREYLFSSQGFRVEILEGNNTFAKETSDRIHIAVSIGAQGSITESKSEEKLEISPNSSYLVCASTQKFSIDLANGSLALFSYRPDL